jgi:tRNA-Thr(GGU) m(6)t(6)A37 methyltransferase TsaA
MKIFTEPVAYVSNSRTEAVDDNWSKIISSVILYECIPTEAFDGIEQFSHLEIIFCFDKVEKKDIIYAGRPGGNPNYPVTGIFAQQKNDRPNKIGLCTVELLKHEGRTIVVKNLDAIDGTPVLDIKPVFKEFLPQKDIMQPVWVSDLMKNYWQA